MHRMLYAHSRRGFLILLIITMSFFAFDCEKDSPASKPTTKEPATAVGSPKGKSASSWKTQGSAIDGLVGDAEVIDVGNGQYRMYYTASPEAGDRLEMYSAISTDGAEWTKEEGLRKEFSTFPDIIRLPDGSYRMYYQNMGVIKSAVSTDGLNWTDEPGVRIDSQEGGFQLDNVGAQSTTILDDGTYLIVYRGVENKRYGDKKLPNQFTSFYFFAVSKDGLTFSKQGLAIDSRNDTFEGALDGAEWVRWDDGKLRLYFWSYKGIYLTDFKDGKFGEPSFEFTSSKDTMSPYPPDVPCDPSLVEIDGKWFMYYGQHPNGIYYAVLD